MKKKNKSKIFAGIALGVLCMGVVLSVVGLSSTIGEIKDVSISKTPGAILASAGVREGKLVSLPVVYYDQKADNCVNLYDSNLNDALYERQFEWSGCGYYNKTIEQGLVAFELDDEYMPVAIGGRLTPNRGVKDLTRWFSTTTGESESYFGSLKMQYVENGTKFIFEAEDFYPLDTAEFSAGDFVNEDGHNHLFTMSFAVPFTVLASGSEQFEIKADDDTFVFVGNRLVIDMGGIHDATLGEFAIRENGEVYAGVNGEELAYSGVNVDGGEGSIVRIFHADRDSESSEFSVKFTGMNLTVTDTKLAQGNDSEIQIAYDPTDPTYVAPLGESSVFKPDSTKGLIIIATIEGVIVVIASVLVASVMRFMIKQKIEK